MLNKKSKFFNYIMLHSILLLYSLGSVFSKKASEYKFLSVEFILYYGIVILILAIYALLWQQVLKRMDLVTAYANKAVTVIWGMIWGIVLYNEKISIYNVLGVIFIIFGVYLVVAEEEKK